MRCLLLLHHQAVGARCNKKQNEKQKQTHDRYSTHTIDNLGNSWAADGAASNARIIIFLMTIGSNSVDKIGIRGIIFIFRAYS
jgi:hypothetical protein